MKMRCETCLQSPFTFLYHFNLLMMLQIYVSTVQRWQMSAKTRTRRSKTVSDSECLVSTSYGQRIEAVRRTDLFAHQTLKAFRIFQQAVSEKNMT